MFGALLSVALVTAAAALPPTPEYTVDGEWLTRTTADDDVLWTRHIGGFEIVQVEAERDRPGVLVVRGFARGPVSFGSGTLIVPERSDELYVVRYAAGDGAFLSARRAR